MSVMLRHIHVEGLDLAGKTTACRGLAAALGGWSIRRNSVCPDNPVYALADVLRRGSGAGPDVLGLLYAAAAMADVERFVPPPADTIQDSTILLRSLAYHTVAGTPHVVAPLRGLLSKHPRFTRSVVLTADRPARLRRLDLRRRNSPAEVAADDLLVVREPERFFAMERMLVSLAREHFGAVAIDTSSLDEPGVVSAILSATGLERPSTEPASSTA